jgi:integrase
VASIWKDSRSPYFVACFTAIVGQRRAQWKRSTFTGDRKIARRIADELEEAAQGRRDSEAVTSLLETIPDLRARRRLHRVFHEVLRKTTGHGMGGKSVRAFTTTWLEITKGEVSQATWAKYNHTARSFLDSLGGKSEHDFSTMRREDVARFRDEQGRRVSASTANLMLKIVRIIFASAEADGVVTRNEARSVKKLKVRVHRAGKRAFTLTELKKLLAVCGDEWKSLVFFGFYTGARLGDLAVLTWQNIDVERNEVHYTSRKTGRTVIVPLANALRAHVERLPAGDDPKQPLHPRAYRVVANEGRTGTLSRQFGELMAVAGLIAPRPHEAQKSGKGRNARRNVSEISFHALRHTAVSLLKSAGVSDAIARDLAGHESAEVSRLYTHIDESAKRSAVNKLPEIG